MQRPVFPGLRQESPFGAYIHLFADRLLKEGHSKQSARRNFRAVRNFSRWILQKKLGLGVLNEQLAEQFLQLCSRRGKLLKQDHATLRRLLAVLREAGAIPPKPPGVSVLGTLEKLENDFERYLTQERGLATASDICHRPIFRRFLHEKCGGGCGSLSTLTVTDINEFVEQHVYDHGPRSAQIMCSILRSFLRYLKYRGEIACDFRVRTVGTELAKEVWLALRKDTCVDSVRKMQYTMVGGKYGQGRQENEDGTQSH